MDIITKKKIIYILIFITSIIILIIGWNKLQDYIFFRPWNDMISYKKLQEIDEFKEIKIKNSEVNLSGWFWNIWKKNNRSLI